VLPLGFVKQSNIASYKVLKRKAPELYTDGLGNVRLKPPLYDQVPLNDFAIPNPTGGDPDPAKPPILWDYHYDLKNYFDWAHIKPTGVPTDKRFPKKFKYRTAHMTQEHLPIGGNIVVIDLDDWIEVEFAAIIQPNFRSAPDLGLVPEAEPTPPSLFEGTGKPVKAIGHTGDFYFDLSTTNAGQARLYGPKVEESGDGNTPQKPSVGKWITDPLPGFANIEDTRNTPAFRKYKSKKGQIFSGLPKLEYCDRFNPGLPFGETMQLLLGPLDIVMDQWDQLPHHYTAWVPRWPVSDETERYGFNDVQEIDTALTRAFFALPVFKPPPGGGDQKVWPSWNPAYDMPVFNTDLFHFRFAHPFASTRRENDFRIRPGTNDLVNPVTIGVGNKPWPDNSMTTTGLPTFGMWTPHQIVPEPLHQPTGIVFNLGLLYLPDKWGIPIGGRETGDLNQEQINPAPLDPFFYDPAHPDGEYGPVDPSNFPWPGSNMYDCTGHFITFNGANEVLHFYFVQTTLIFD
jgi:hypothetical protein